MAFFVQWIVRIEWNKQKKTTPLMKSDRIDFFFFLFDSGIHIYTVRQAYSSIIMLRSKFIAWDFVKWLIELKSSEINIDGKRFCAHCSWFVYSLFFFSLEMKEREWERIREWLVWKHFEKWINENLCFDVLCW